MPATSLPILDKTQPKKMVCADMVCADTGRPHRRWREAVFVGRTDSRRYEDQHDSVSERLRRWTRNPLGSARRGSNPLAVDYQLVRHGACAIHVLGTWSGCVKLYGKLCMLEHARPNLPPLLGCRWLA